jgi:arsenate reductase
LFFNEFTKIWNKTMKKIKVLILCTGNSSRSQMAAGFLRSFDPDLQIYSAGTDPAPRVHPKTVEVMKEEGIDLGGISPQNVDQFLKQSFDFVITVCDQARESCPLFSGRVRHRLHIGFIDPAAARGTEQEVLQVFRKVRDEIKTAFYDLYRQRMQGASRFK